jgi:multiple sugar transport system substrate-binding protein
MVNKIKRLRAATALMLSAAILVTGCVAAAAQQEQITLRYAWWGNDLRHRLTQEVIDLFEERNPDITIEGEFSGLGGYLDRLSTAFAAGDAPDILQLPAPAIGEWAARGALRNLDDFAGVLDISKIDPGVVNSAIFDGARAGVPSGVNSFGVLINPSVFEQAGVALPDTEKWTWKDFLDVSARITANTPDGVYGAQDTTGGMASFRTWIRQHGGELDVDGLRTTEEVVAGWFQLGLDLIASGATPPASLTAEVNSGAQEQSLFATSRAAIWPSATNLLNAFEKLTGKELQLVRFPGETEFAEPGMRIEASGYLSVTSTSAHAEAAAKFIDFMLNDPDAGAILLSERGLPVNLDIRSQLAATAFGAADQKTVAFLTGIQDDLNEWRTPPAGAGPITAILGRYTEEVFFGRQTPQQAAKGFLSEAQAALDAV